MAAWPGPRIIISFSLNLPNAKQVYLAGEMTDWDNEKVALTKGKDGVWRVSLSLPAGQWVYNSSWTANGVRTQVILYRTWTDGAVVIRLCWSATAIGTFPNTLPGAK